LNSFLYKLKKFLLLNEAFFISLILLLPNLIWILLDKSLWRGDPCGYALGSVFLHKYLVTDLWIWAHSMMYGYKGPLILWIGQVFVGIGDSIGNVSLALLIIPFISSFISIVLLYKSFFTFFQSRLIAFCGSIVVAGSPLFFGISTGFWVEPIQLAIIAWGIYSLTKVNKWSLYFAISQYIIFFSIALLAKTSTLLYVIVPSMVFWYNFSKQYNRENLTKRDAIFIAISLFFAIPTATFYLLNYSNIVGFAHFAATSTLFSTNQDRVSLFWDNLSSGIFSSIGCLTFLVLLPISAYKYIKHWRNNKVLIGFLLPVFQISLFLFSWLFSINEDARYFIPLIPYFALLVCWALYTCKIELLTMLVTLIFVIQLAKVDAIAFNLYRLDSAPAVLKPLTIWSRNMEILQEILPLSTTDTSLVVDLLPQFGSAEIQYELAKQKSHVNWQKSCLDIGAFLPYNRQEIDTNEINIDTVWHNLLSANPTYYVTWQTRLSASEATKEVFEIDRYTALTVKVRWALADKIKNSGLYEPIFIQKYPELLVYKRIEE
jgi:hypothetical protein